MLERGIFAELKRGEEHDNPEEGNHLYHRNFDARNDKRKKYQTKNSRHINNSPIKANRLILPKIIDTPSRRIYATSVPMYHVFRRLGLNNFSCLLDSSQIQGNFLKMHVPCLASLRLGCLVGDVVGPGWLRGPLVWQVCIWTGGASRCGFRSAVAVNCGGRWCRTCHNRSTDSNTSDLLLQLRERCILIIVIPLPDLFLSLFLFLFIRRHLPPHHPCLRHTV